MTQSHALSYWQQTVPALPLRTDVPQLADVVVIGGGLLEAATCYWLAREGRPVALLERTSLAFGATGRNGGFVRAGPAESYPDTIAHLGYETAHAVLVDTNESQPLLRQIIWEEAIACDYREPGALRLALHEQELEHLEREVQVLQADRFQAHLLDRQQVQDLIPTPLASEILGGQLFPKQGLVHSARLVYGLMQAALRRGAQAYQAEVLHVIPEGTHVRLLTSRGPVQAGTVVVAVNAWTGQLLPELAGVIVPAREQMLAYAPGEPIFPLSISAPVITDEYFQHTPDGTILIGGCSSVAPDEVMGTWESQPTAVVQQAIEQVLPRLFPSLTPLQVTHRWAGLLGYTSDHHPIVDEVPTRPGVLVVGGFSGHGMPFGMRFGQLLATAVLSGMIPSALKPYRLNRPTLKKRAMHEGS
jgi:gamma-glutamylputrescine oxidase